MGADNIPKKLGKYEITGELGKGNMATVYYGYDPFISRDVAVKVAHPAQIRDENLGPKFKKMFFNEARIAGMLDHKYILPVYDAGIEGDLLYIVMEQVKGGETLNKYCDKNNLLPIPKVLEIIYKCCKALNYAHTRNVIHRDIKPSNILVTEDLDIRISDFGIAQIVKTEATQEVELLGTPLYMSPEQINEEVLTGQTDLFSLGVVMYKLLTGNNPFSGEKMQTLLKKILHDEPPLLRSFRDDLPESLEFVIKRALAKNPNARYPSGNDFAADLTLAFNQFKHRIKSDGTADSSIKEKFDLLKGNRFFSDFFDSELNDVINASEWLDFSAGQTIINEGDFDDSFFIIIKGEVFVQKAGATITRLSAGDCFGEMGYFSKVKRTASIVAADDVTITKVSNTLMEKAPVNCQLRFMKKFLYTLIHRLTVTSEKLAKSHA